MYVYVRMCYGIRSVNKLNPVEQNHYFDTPFFTIESLSFGSMMLKVDMVHGTAVGVLSLDFEYCCGC